MASVIDSGTLAPGNGTSPWPSRIAVTAVHFFILILFLQNVGADTWAAVFGFLVIHAYSVLCLRYWSRLERSVAGDIVIVTVTLEYVLIAILFWDAFSQYPWSAFAGLILLQVCTFSCVAFWKELRKAPPTAWFGLVVILLYVMIAATAPIVSPFGETEIVGSPDEPWGDQFLLGTDSLGRDMLTRLIYGARNTVAFAFITTVLAFVLGTLTGLLATTIGGWVDQLLGRFVDVLMAIPSADLRACSFSPSSAPRSPRFDAL